MPPPDPHRHRMGNGRGQPSRSRTYGGYSDHEFDPNMGHMDYNPNHHGSQHPPGSFPSRSGGPGMNQPGPPLPMRGPNMSAAGVSSSRRGPIDHSGHPAEYGDSDIESVVSGTSAFSSHSAPHSRSRRMG